MHRHNLDQIAEYAQGNLANEATAAALVETCETCRAEFESQRAMITLLSGATTASMTDHEKAALHREVWTELRSPPAATAGTGGPWWRAWAFGAAALVFVAVGLVGVLTNVGGSGDAVTETFDEIASSLDAGGEDAAETTRAEDGAAVAEEAPTSTMAAATDLSSAGFEAIANSVRSDEPASYDGATQDTDEGRDCLESAGLTDHVVVPGYEDRTDLIVAVPRESQADDIDVFFVDPTSCELTHVED